MWSGRSCAVCVDIEDCGCYRGMSLPDLNNVALKVVFKVVPNRIGHLQGALYAWAVFIVLTV